MEFLMVEWWTLPLALLSLGGLTGVLAGLLGIGGGTVLVPALFYGYVALGYDPAHMMHVAVGTALAVMIPTGLASSRAHWRKVAVRKDILPALGSGLLAGVFCGIFLADLFSGRVLRIIFAMALLGVAILMFVDPARFMHWPRGIQKPWSWLAGIIVGVLSTLMGIGGAALNVPYMRMCGVPIHQAVGTAAALGLFISIPGTIGFILIGLPETGLPAFSLGYVNVLAWVMIVPTGILMAPFGAALAHKLPVRTLQYIFAAFIAFVAIRMLIDLP